MTASTEGQRSRWPLPASTVLTFYLEEDVGGVVHTHDQSARPQHVVGVGERDEDDGGQVVEQHDQKILQQRN